MVEELFFANVYLNDLDQFVKHELKCRYYLRYCDDFVLLSDNPAQLEQWHGQIADFLQDRLKLALNPAQTRLKPVSSGIDFLGYIIRRRYVLVRRRVINNFKERIRYFDAKLSVGADSIYALDSVSGPTDTTTTLGQGKHRIRWHFPPAEVEVFRSTVASYLGHLKWADSFQLKQTLFVKHPVLRACFMLNEYEITPRYIPPRGQTKFRRSYHWWVPDSHKNGHDNRFIVGADSISALDIIPVLGSMPVRNCSNMGQIWNLPLPTYHGRNEIRYPLWTNGKKGKVLVFFQVGCFYEFYDTQAELAHKVLNLKKMTGLHRFRLGCGFHKRYLSRCIQEALKNGYHVALIRQDRRVDGSILRRLTTLIRADEPIKVLEYKAKRGVQMELPF